MTNVITEYDPYEGAIRATLRTYPQLVRFTAITRGLPERRDALHVILVPPGVTKAEDVVALAVLMQKLPSGGIPKWWRRDREAVDG